MNVLSKQYKGPFYILSIVITLAIMVVNSEEVADLNLSWLPIVAQGLAVAAWLVQQYTPIGDGGAE